MKNKRFVLSFERVLSAVEGKHERLVHASTSPVLSGAEGFSANRIFLLTARR